MLQILEKYYSLILNNWGEQKKLNLFIFLSVDYFVFKLTL